MVNVTTEAKDLLQDLLEDAQEQAGIADEEVGIRLAPATPSETTGDEGEGRQVALGLMLDRAHEGDEVVEHNGKKVLMVDQRMSDLLDGITLDAVDTPEGKQLAITR